MFRDTKNQVDVTANFDTVNDLITRLASCRKGRPREQRGANNDIFIPAELLDTTIIVLYDVLIALQPTPVGGDSEPKD